MLTRYNKKNLFDVNLLTKDDKTIILYDLTQKELHELEMEYYDSLLKGDYEKKGTIPKLYSWE